MGKQRTKKLTKGCFLLNTTGHTGAFCYSVDKGKGVARIIPLHHLNDFDLWQAVDVRLDKVCREYRILEYGKDYEVGKGNRFGVLGAEYVLQSTFYYLTFDRDGRLSSSTLFKPPAVVTKSDGTITVTGYKMNPVWTEVGCFLDHSTNPLDIVVDKWGFIPFAKKRYRDITPVEMPEKTVQVGEYSYMLGKYVYTDTGRLLGMAYALTATGLQLDSGVLIPVEELVHCTARDD